MGGLVLSENWMEVDWVGGEGDQEEGRKGTWDWYVKREIIV